MERNKLLEEIQAFEPFNEQEEKDKAQILKCVTNFEDIFMRDNKIAHITSSSWIVNKERTKVLIIYHNIYDSWSWTGGHADGEEDLLAVAVREAKEETGIVSIKPVVEKIFSLETVCVNGHIKRGEYVPSHLHLNITYILEADDSQQLQIKEDENSGVKWFDFKAAPQASSEPWMRNIYEKLNEKVKLNK